MASASGSGDLGKEKEGGNSTIDGGFTAKFKKMVLTEKEKKVLVMEDLEDEESDQIAVVGKILSPTKFHIQTIISALRPQWGNPKGLEFKAMGDNVFMATLEREQDRKRIWEGAPWLINNHAVVLDDFVSSMRPSEVRFSRIPIWIQCHDLPFNWLNAKRAENIAKQIGTFIKLDTSGNSRGWGQSFRARIWLDVEEPIQRFIQIDSQKRKELIPYPIVYEKLPYFCFSCGRIGHSAGFCLTPAERDEEGNWPYDSSIRAIDLRKVKREFTPNDGGQMRHATPSRTGPFNYNAKEGPGRLFAPGSFMDSSNLGPSNPIQFNAQLGGRGGGRQRVNRRLQMENLMYAPKKDAVLGELVDDRQGTKRTALINSPSKIDSDAIDAKKKRALGDEEEVENAVDMEETTNVAEADDQPRLSQ
ncbi:hypothetical protein ACQ4PT_035662 [Festuca glaucescens]